MSPSQDVSLRRSSKASKSRAALDAAIDTIQILRGFVPLEPGQGALESLCIFLKLFQTNYDNQDGIFDIAERCQRVAYLLKKTTENSQLVGDDMMKATQRLKNSVIDSTTEIIKKKRERRTWVKMWRIRTDADELQELKEMLRDFIAEFDMELGVIVNLDVKEILQWVKAQESQKNGSTNPSNSALYTPPKPPIFFGRDSIVNDCVHDLMQSSARHVALIGTGGMGKSTIAKAILNAESIVASFSAQLYVTFDGTAASSMTFQLFLDQIGDALGLSTPTSKAVLQRLLPMRVLLVIDNAESLLDALEADVALIFRILEDIGAQSSTRIIITTRNTEAIPPNLPFHRIQVSGLDSSAAREAFLAVYSLPSFDVKISQILSDLQHHPLSINILANVAVMNDWTPTELCRAWEERQTELLDGAQDDKYRSLRVTIELSMKTFKDKHTVLELLRAIAFLPQGIETDDLTTLFSSVDIARHAEAVRRSSLVYRSGGRITMLAPIRMYIMHKYNHDLPYLDPILSKLRGHYYGHLSTKAEASVRKEHINMDRLLHFDLSSKLYQSEPSIRAHVLKSADRYLDFVSYSYFSPTTSLWPLLVRDADNSIYKKDEALALSMIRCMSWLCWAQYHRFKYDEALRDLAVAESFSRSHGSIRTKWTAECLRLKGFIYQACGDLALADKALREGCSLARSLGHEKMEALFHHPLSQVALRKGNIAEAKVLAAASISFKPGNEQLQIGPLLHYADIAVCEMDLDSARQSVNRALELDRIYNAGKKRLLILNAKANVEGWAGKIPEVMKILDDVLLANAQPGMPTFSDYVTVRALRGKAYYYAKLGNLNDAHAALERAFAMESESGMSVSSVKLMLTSAYVEMLGGNVGKAQKKLHSILDRQDREDRQWEAIVHRALGEVACLGNDTSEAKAQFETTLSLCESMGVPPTFLYVGYFHMDTLPAEYGGWNRFTSTGSL